MFVDPTAGSAAEIRDMEMGRLEGGSGGLLSGPVEGCIVAVIIVVATGIALIYD